MISYRDGMFAAVAYLVIPATPPFSFAFRLHGLPRPDSEGAIEEVLWRTATIVGLGADERGLYVRDLAVGGASIRAYFLSSGAATLERPRLIAA